MTSPFLENMVKWERKDASKLKHMSKQDKIKEQIDEIRYEIEDFFDNGERRKDVYKYDDHKILAEIVEKKLNTLLEEERKNIAKDLLFMIEDLYPENYDSSSQAPDSAECVLGKIKNYLQQI